MNSRGRMGNLSFICVEAAAGTGVFGDGLDFGLLFLRPETGWPECTVFLRTATRRRFPRDLWGSAAREFKQRNLASLLSGLFHALTSCFEVLAARCSGTLDFKTLPSRAGFSV